MPLKAALRCVQRIVLASSASESVRKTQEVLLIEGHLFITLLAYHLVHTTIRTQLKAQGIHDSWETIRRKLENQQRITVSLKRDDGKTVHVRKTTRAEPHQKAMYDALGISAQPGNVEKTVV